MKKQTIQAVQAARSAIAALSLAAVLLLSGALALDAGDIGRYGRFNIPGMPLDLYETAISAPWAEIQPINPTDETPSLAYDLNKRYTYRGIERRLTWLSSNADARLFRIGVSEEGRPLYGVELGGGEKVILLTGGVHAREFAGTDYIMKMLFDLAALRGRDERVTALLDEYKIAAIPCVNPDGRERILRKEFPPDAKYNAAGIDINRNFPSINAGQLKKGRNVASGAASSRPGNNYPGKHLGEAPETQAVMNWLHRYIVNEQALYLLELHQQGRVVYTEKTWDIPERRKRTNAFSRRIRQFLNYREKSEEAELAGEGGSVTDYAVSIAAGYRYDGASGRLGLQIGAQTLPYLLFAQMRGYTEHLTPVNPHFVSFTVEIGPAGSTGPGAKAREHSAKEFYAHHFDELLLFLMEG